MLTLWLVLTACDTEEAHEYTYNETQRLHDEAQHWHGAVCGHTVEIKDEAEHSFNDVGVCDICSYSKDMKGFNKSSWIELFETVGIDRSSTSITGTDDGILEIIACGDILLEISNEDEEERYLHFCGNKVYHYADRGGIW